ncbi:hypothetical protein HY029_04605 [Candidatus Gottesmanbacteria bacterium]|nr:hypothetical protein [Candidatus Gottesmanbacteria bacterium]
MINSSIDQTSQARSLLEGAKEVLIALPGNPSFDSVASALSFYLGLSARGVQVNVVCPDQMTVEFNQLVGVDKVTGNVSNSQGKNLVISFPYQEGSIEKVSYNIENDTFNLVIEPREGYPMITADAIRFASSGGNTDLIITIGISKLADLNQIYNNNQGLFAEKPIVNIDNSNQNTRFGKVNIVDTNISSISELTLSLFSNFGLTINNDTATNILAGMTNETDNFNSPQTQASTYEAAAQCLRSGARKISISKTFTPPSQPMIPSFNKPVMPKNPQQKPKIQFPPQIQPTQPQPQPQQPKKQQSNEAPPDWLKPKIYKGSTLL